MTYRAAIVGAGAPLARTNANLEGFSIGYAHAGAYQAHPDVEVVAVADINDANATALAASVGGAATYSSLAHLLTDSHPDILSICTWPTLHHEMVTAAVDAGVPMIICEKPMAVGLDEIDDMVTRAESAGCRLFVNHQRRFQQPFSGTRRLIDDGHLGTLLRIEGYIGDGWDLMSWGSHWVDMARYLAADEPVRWVLAASHDTGNVRYGHHVEDQMLLQLGFDNGVLALVHTGPHVTGSGLVVTGTTGSLLLNSRSAPTLLAGDRTEQLRAEYIGVAADAADSFARAVDDAIRSTETGTPGLISAASGHADTEIIMAAYSSAADRAVVRLPMTERTANRRINDNGTKGRP